jgi:high-affinity nickel-transport protein
MVLHRIVIITSIVVAATAAAVRDKFDKYSQIGGIIGSSVSAGFLIILGIMNVFILFRLVKHLRAYLRSAQDGPSAYDSLELVGGGVFVGLLQKMFKLIDR